MGTPWGESGRELEAERLALVLEEWLGVGSALLFMPGIGVLAEASSSEGGWVGVRTQPGKYRANRYQNRGLTLFPAT